MRAGKQQLAPIAGFPAEPTLFGGYDPFTHALRLTVEASSLAEARRRLSAVAPLVEIKEVSDFMVLAMDRPSRKVPMFMQGYFEATRLGMKRDGLAAAGRAVQ